MATKTGSSPLLFVRSLAAGVLFSILLLYAAHVLGAWRVESYRPHAQTTFTALLHNRCALFGAAHTLRPAAGTPTKTEGINGTKLAGSFLIFYEGHLLAAALVALAVGGCVFALRRQRKRMA